MKIIQISEPATKNKVPNIIDNEIHVITQFFNHSNIERNLEIKQCLKYNVKNVNISKIHLLNEKIYSDEEIGLCSDKIIQINIKKRLKFNNVLEYVRINSIKGYIIIINCDIFFDLTLENLAFSELHNKKIMFALLRYEYNGYDTKTSPLFGPRIDSQDTWIFHSNNIIIESHEKVFNFKFGIPGCDNKILYLLNILGYKIINDPLFLKSFHYHTSQIRDYSIKDIILNPYGCIVPFGSNTHLMPSSLGINLRDIHRQDIWFEDNNLLKNYIESKMDNNISFLIPRIAGIENNNLAVFQRVLGDKTLNNVNRINITNYIKNIIPSMKNNTGIKLSSGKSIQNYSDLYLEAFQNCDMYSGWDIQGNVFKHISHSHEYIKKSYFSKKIIWSCALEIYHYIYSNPWTHALKGKRILIISPFKETILEQIQIRSYLYDNIDLFPQCTFLVLKPPMTQGDESSTEFDDELSNFYIKLDEIKEKYDVALLSCGGYGNIISNHIYEKHHKSAIYVGGVLQMYFGIYGTRWLKERPDIIRLFINKYWKRPKESERPNGHGNIESSCYW